MKHATTCTTASVEHKRIFFSCIEMFAGGPPRRMSAFGFKYHRLLDYYGLIHRIRKYGKQPCVATLFSSRCVSFHIGTTKNTILGKDTH